MSNKYSVFFETSEVLEAIKEDETEGVKKVSGIFMQAEKVNRNGRIYARETLQEAINEYQSIIQDGDSYGALDHPDNLEMKFNEASHFITKLEMIGNDVYGEAVLFSKTPSGQLIEDIFETKRKVGVPVKVGMSSRGAGKLVKRNNNSYVENYKLIAVDLVCRPSAQDAYVNSIRESEYIYENGVFRKHKTVNESAYKQFLANYSKYLQGNK
jgi:hypothetical protein